MKRTVFALCLMCALASGLIEDNSDSKQGWHRTTGIKVAQEIKALENRMVVQSPIVGGVIAPTNAHPYLVGLLIDVRGLSSPSACGGSLLTSNRILTAAHCWFDGQNQAWRITAVLGSAFLFHGGLRVNPSGISVHPRYDHRTFANDIAMLYTPTHIPFSFNIRPVNLPNKHIQNLDLTNYWAKASGYGRYSDATRPNTNVMARHVWLRMVRLAECRGYYGDIVLDSNICTSGYGGVGVCQGDSGGPLTVTQTNGETFLIGVSSFVARDGCELEFPSVFARVSYYMDWIRSQL